MGAIMTVTQAFSKSLKAARKAKGLTQEDFALISSRTYLSTLERGLKNPTIEKVHVLAERMGIHPLTLLTLTYMQLMDNPRVKPLLDRVKREVTSILAAKD